MKFSKQAILVVTISALTTVSAFADTYVRGYVKSDGTYVAPHSRSDSDNSYNNNWSVQGNTNPYTGSYGTERPTYNDRTPTYNTNTYGNPGYTNSGGLYSGQSRSNSLYKGLGR